MKTLFGNAVVGQSGGPTAAINATLAGVIYGVFEAQERGEIGKLYGARNGMEGLLEERFIDLDEAMRYALTSSLAHVQAQGKTLHPDTLAALNDYHHQ